MSQNRKPVERTYYQRDHLYFLFRRWRSILLAGLICALLGVSYTVYRNVTLWDAMLRDYESAMVDYRNAYDDYLEESVSLEFAIADCEQQMNVLEEQQQTDSDEYQALKTRVDELNNAVRSLQEPICPFYPTWQHVVRTSARRALIGFIGGVLLAILVWYHLVFCLKGRIYSAGDVAEITLLPVLGILPQPRKKGRVLPPDRWIQRWDGIDPDETEEEAYLRVSARLRERLAGRTGVLLVGPVPLDQLQAVAARLAPDLGQTEVACAAHPAAEDVLNGCDAVVLTAKRGGSRAADLAACQEAAMLGQKTVIGTIVL